MNYKERIGKAVEFLEEEGGWLGEGESAYDPESGGVILCIYYSDQVVLGSGTVDKYYLITHLAEGLDVRATFHYGGYSYEVEDGDKSCRDDWGFTFSMFCEVGRSIQPYYQAWLDKMNFTLETREMDEAPWMVDVIHGKKKD